jgi:hypothetical protein
VHRRRGKELVDYHQLAIDGGTFDPVPADCSRPGEGADVQSDLVTWCEMLRSVERSIRTSMDAKDGTGMAVGFAEEIAIPEKFKVMVIDFGMESFLEPKPGLLALK